jgi:hypothetical protein
VSLRNWLRSYVLGAGDPITRVEFDALTKAVEALDEVQLQREMAWKEIRDQLKRYLSRAAAYEQRDKARASADDTDLAALIRTKYPRLNGGS